MLRRLVSAQILPFRTVGFFLAVNQNTPKSLGYATSTNNRRSWRSAMKQDWHPDELAQRWRISAEERELLDSKTSATRLSFAVLLKAFRFDGRFPERREDIAGRIVTYLASQTLAYRRKHTPKASGASAHNATSALKFAGPVASESFASRTNPLSSRG